tara:strand:- start:389 stop:1618 length:1230 start_codon:yes stop_codon:yes gene_type:complete
MRNFFLLALSLLTLVPASAENWPQFRGPNGSGIAANAEAIPNEWSANENLAWKTELPGKGSSSPIIWGDRIFLTSYSGYGESQENPGDRGNLKRHLICLNKADGKILWETPHQAENQVSGYANFVAHHGYASHTPVTDGKAVYVFYAKEGALAYDFDGNLLWHFTGVGTDTGGFGSGGALALSEDLLIVNASSESKAIIALDKATGKEVWRKEGIVQCYNTPGLADDVVLVNARDQFLGLDARTGAERWKLGGPDAYVCNSPTVVDGIAYAIQGGRGPTVAISAEGKTLWSSKRAVTVPSPAIRNGLIFIPERDIFTCLDASTGEEVYRERVSVPITDRTYASPLVIGDRILVVTRKDGAMIYAASRNFELLAHNKIVGDDSLWNASPAVSDGRLFLRSERAIYCIAKP